MKTKHEVVTTRSNGLRHFDEACQKIGRDGVVRLTAEIIREFSGNPNMPLCLSWAMRNAIDGVLKPNRDLWMGFNASEVFTSKEIEEFGKIGWPYDPGREDVKRKKGPEVPDELIVSSVRI